MRLTTTTTTTIPRPTTTRCLAPTIDQVERGAPGGREEPLRVLHVVHSLGAGGMENGVVNVASRLDRSRFAVSACCLTERGAFADRLPDPEKVYPLEKPEGFSQATVRALSAVLRSVRPHVVHTHNLGPLLYASLATAFGRRFPIVHGEHGQPDDGPSSRKRYWQRRLFFRAATRVHTVSDSLLEHFIEQGFPEDRMLAVVNGVDTERFCPGDRTAAKRAIGIPEDAVVFGIVGRFIASKRHTLLIEAFEEVHRDLPGSHLLIVGAGGAEEESIRERALSSPAAEKICLTGFQAEPAPFYRAMDLLACPSTIEGLSNAVLEAMACAVPVLAHSACGMAEVITDRRDGLLADLSTVEGLRDALLAAGSVPGQLASLGGAARETVTTGFSLDRMTAEYAALYQEVATL